MSSLKKSSTFFASLLFISLITIGISQIINHDHFETVYSNEQSYSLTLNAATGTLTTNTNDGYKSQSYGPISTSLGNPIGFYFANGMKSSVSNTLGQLQASTGVFYNTTALTGISSITVNYSSTANMQLYFGNSSNPSTNQSSLATGSAIVPSSNYSYFRIATGNKYATITSIVIEYTCYTGGGSGDTSTSEGSDTSSSEGGTSSTSDSTLESNHFSLVTSISDLSIGSSYLITALSGGNYYAAGSLSSTYLQPVSISAPSNNVVTITSEEVATFVLGGTSGAYTLTSGEGQLYSSAAKSINYSSSGTGTWTIACNGTTSTITNTTTSYGSLQYNSDAPRFTTYATTQTAIGLYKSSDSAPVATLSSLSITTPPTKTNYLVGENLNLSGMIVTATYSDNSTGIISSQNYTANPTNGSILSTTGSVVITVSYTYIGITKNATTTVTVSESSANYTVKTMNYDYQDYMNNNYYSNVDSMPSTGNVNLLVIPVQLQNYSMTEATRSRIQKAYFGTEEETGWHSVASFYSEESHGRLNITGVVSPIYSTSYGASITQAQTTTLVSTATNWYKTNYSTQNGTEFDSDSDGFIDGVVLIYSAPNYTSNNDNLWAYCYWTNNTKNTTSPTAKTFFWASYDFMDESANASIDAHTYIHEAGHLMGLDDYYNYDNNSNYGAAGAFNMQDYNVGEHDPYSRVSLGWIDPIVPTGSTSLTIEPGEAIILSPNDLSSNSPFDEYLILDVYSPTGLNLFDSTYKYGGSSSMYPKGPNVTGIRVWHVDARLMQNYYSGTPTLTSTITAGNDYTHAMSNSTGEDYGSIYSGYRNYKLLHLLQNGGTNTYVGGGQFSAEDVWTAGESFSMSSYASFFVNSGKLNSNLSLPYSFSVTAINGTSVTLSIVKN